MKLLLILLTAISIPCQAAVCGLYQIEDFGDRVLYSIVRFTNTQNASSVQTLFTITNPGNPTVRGMVRGVCYCVSGIVQADPEFLGDENYQLLTLARIEDQGYTGCLPTATPDTPRPANF